MANNVQDKFDNPSKLFIWFFSIGNYFRGKSYYKDLIDEMHLTGTESVLDFGSGVGSLSSKLAPLVQENGHLTCVDVSEKLLQHTQRKLKKFSNVDYFHGDIRDSSMPNNTFDFIVSTWVLHHIPKSNLPQVIQKLYDLLKENGRIMIIEFPDSNYKHTKMTQLELIDMFKQVNFSYRVVFTKKHGILYEFTK